MTDVDPILVDFKLNSRRIEVGFSVPIGLELDGITDEWNHGQRKDSLWKGNCLECFLKMESGYLEINVGKNGDWAAYSFEDYREGMRDVKEITVESKKGLHRFEIGFDLAEPLSVSDPVQFNPTLVSKTEEGELLFWAIRHPSDQPDFHRDRYWLSAKDLEGESCV